MRILALSDLHLYFIEEPWRYGQIDGIQKRIQDIIAKENPDCIVISGDIFEYDLQGNPYKYIRNIIGNDTIPVICSLGNHEFAYRTIEKTLRFYNSFDIKNRYDVHYLDVEGHFEFKGYNFVGNVFWYDNSLKSSNMADDFIVSKWLDSTIKMFKPSRANTGCKNQIIKNLSDKKNNILITHTVPHKDLNRFSFEDPTGIYNQYSGCKDFLVEIKDKLVAAFCGHTHRREIKEIYEIPCVNCGNEYFEKSNRIDYFLLEL